MGHLPVTQVTKQHIKDAREAMTAAPRMRRSQNKKHRGKLEPILREGKPITGLSRKVVNQRVGRIKRAFRWLADEGKIPDAVEASIARIAPLPACRSAATVAFANSIVATRTVARTLKVLPEPWRSMIRLQWYTGMRPGEMCGLQLEYLSPVVDGCMVAGFDLGRV